MQKNIVVSLHCQTFGIANALAALFPEHQVTPLLLPAPTDEAGQSTLRDMLEEAEFWLTCGQQELATGLQVKTLGVPTLYFDAFHPDLIYATQRSTGKITQHHYNSLIAVWAYNNRVTPQDATRLYREEVYRAMGYLDRWAQSAAHLRQLFSASGLEPSAFTAFFRAIKRQGLFMYSVNHPYPQVLVELSKQLALQMGAAPPLVHREIIIPDAMTSLIWPVYPEIGTELGLDGHYIWRINGKEIHGLLNYLEFSYQAYEAQGILPGDLLPAIQAPEFEVILSKALHRP